MLLKHGCDFLLGQRTAECGGPVVDFGPAIRLQFGDDIVPVVFREPEFNGSEVALEKLHGGFSFLVR
jgi:hypothetical protein